MTLTVLHVIPSFAGGGAERQLVELSTGLSRAGVDVHVAYLHDGPMMAAAACSGASLHRIECSGNHDPRVLSILRRLTMRLRPAILQTWLLHADVFGGIAARWCGVPWVLSERSSAAMYRHGLKFRVRCWLGLRADAIIANSEGGLQYWRDAGYRGSGTVIRNIVRRPETIPTHERSHTREPVLLAIGRLSAEKNHALLLEVLKIVFSRHPEVTATILGEGPERATLEARIASSSALKGRVYLPGHTSDVSGLLARASVFVSLSRFEGTPNTVLEAIVHDCPLVLSDIPAHRELIPADETSFVSLENPLSIADALCAKLSNPAGAHDQASRARHRADAWSAEQSVESHLALYRSLTSRRNACALS